MRQGQLIAFYCLLGSSANAQTYSAPGMPLHMQRRPFPAQQVAATSQAYIAPRFWKLKDSAYVKAAVPFYQHVSRHFTWPSSTLKAGLEGQVTVRLILLPDGSVGRAEIAQLALKQAEGYMPEEGLERGTAALEAEALLFMKKLRFEPAALNDTIMVPLSLRMQ